MNIVEATLNEIEIGGDVEGNFPDDMDKMDLSGDQLDLFDPIPPGEPKLPPNSKLVGRMGEYFVIEYHNPAWGDMTDRNGNRKGGLFVWIKKGQAASFVEMKGYTRDEVQYPYEMQYKPDLHGVGLRVGAVFVKPEFRGSRLGTDMYVWLLQNVCDYLMADSLQTPAGVKLWKSLRRDSRLAVEVWDGDKYKSRPRRTGKDWDHVYNTGHLIPWVTLKGKVEDVLWGKEDE